jgi:Protein of unknown function (DUF2721)
MNYSDNIRVAINPLMLLSSGGLLILALYNRYFITVDRLRKFDRELLQEYEKKANAHSSRHGYCNQIISMFQNQIKRINKRAKVLKYSLISMLLSFLTTLIICMILLADDTHIAIVLTYISLSFMFIGILLALVEMIMSLNPVIEEERFIRKELSIPDITELNP